MYELSKPAVCEDEETIEAGLETYEYSGGCEAEYYVVCIDGLNNKRDVTGAALVVSMAGGTFVATLALALLIAMRRGSVRRRRRRRGR